MSLIKVRVYPDSDKEKIQKNSDDFYSVYLREPAKKGMANRRLLEILRETVQPKPKRIKIASGHTSPSKIIEVEY
ncbi:MAG TPA: DUF167 domain-containing protein [Candidatus Paceibacterota bacterium]